jgi:hypothetical protein
MRRDAARTDWVGVFEDLYGYSPLEPTEPDYYKPLRVMSQEVFSVLTAQAQRIRRQIAIEAHQVGLTPYLQYVYFVLMERSSNWPDMPESRVGALSVLREILTEADAVPPYERSIKLPPGELEANLDEMLLNLSLWAGTELKSVLRKEYWTQVKRSTRAFQKTLPGIETDMVGTMFENKVRNSPKAFPNGHFLSHVFSILL